MWQVLENRFLYFPSKYPDYWEEPSSYGLAFEDVWVATEDGRRIHGWWFPRDHAEFTVLFCHGNGGHIADRLPLIESMFRRVSIPFSLFIFDYAGYGRSPGTPSEQRLYCDARSSLIFLANEKRLNPAETLVLGRSLGSGVAVQLATEYRFLALILECPLLSVHEMSQLVFGSFKIPDGLIRQKFDNISKINRINCPVLIVHGDRDMVVPFDQGVRLYEEASDPKSFIRIPGADHDNLNLVGGDLYYDAWNAFIRKSIALKSGDR